ncbi:MAG: universal stress protein [Planctomycetaceae bacterium]|nr:universal stress protein [Planctomycetaceae bacterium]
MTFSSQKIVVPVDFSGESENAIRTAVDIAGDCQRIHLLHVLLPLDSISPGVLLGDVSDEKREAKINEHLNEIAGRCGAGKAHVKALFGDPGMEIADYAQKIGADLIVIPSHGYHGVKRLVLGSVAERVIRHANCSVLVVRRSDAE